MIRIAEIKLPLTQADQAQAELHLLAAQRLGVAAEALADVQIFKRSFDARSADVYAVYIVDVRLSRPADEAALLARHAHTRHISATPDMHWSAPALSPAPDAPRPVIVGFGPCGIFAALALAQMGLRPIVIERGKAVRERTQDTWGLWRKGVLNPLSNVQFGEGGAGTFSDGKLYSQIKDPQHLGRKALNELVQAGAPPEILWAAHPHIGTFKLVKVVEQLRAQIIALGGEVRFEQQVVDLALQGAGSAQRVVGLRVQDWARGTSYDLSAEQVVLALGHSARESFVMLHERGVALQAKPFSIGFRIEHPQSVIDRARWGRHAGHPLLGAADYKLVHHASNGRTVYSFCMCPGGTVVAATSEVGRVVTNGMSQYSRNERNANAALVVGIDPNDYPQGDNSKDAADWSAAFDPEAGARYAEQAQRLRSCGQHHPLAGIVMQRRLEAQAYVLGGGGYTAPGQLVGDFLAGQASSALGSVEPSYKPGVCATDLRAALPDYAIAALQEALPAFGRKIAGYDMPDAVLTGVETRTSAPLRTPRGEDFQSLNVRGLYPAGEGAGYAGGILSAAVDGLKVALALAQSWPKNHKGAGTAVAASAPASELASHRGQA